MPTIPYVLIVLDKGEGLISSCFSFVILHLQVNVFFLNNVRKPLPQAHRIYTSTVRSKFLFNCQ